MINQNTAVFLHCPPTSYSMGSSVPVPLPHTRPSVFNKEEVGTVRQCSSIMRLLRSNHVNAKKEKNLLGSPSW